MQFQVLEKIIAQIKTLQSAGYEAYLVGGCVRDMIMGRTPNDWDITTDANPEQIMQVFETAGFRVVYENTFGTVGIVDEAEEPDSSIRTVEITPYRLDVGYTDHRHPDQVVFSKKLEDDLMRRDFTINAMAYNPSIGHLVDLYKGHEDIKDMSIRAVGNPDERFKEDALRMMRAVRFSAQLGFSVSHETMQAIFENAGLLEKVSRERIRDEFIKIIVSREPSVGIGFLVKLGLMQHVIPELLEGIKCEQKGAHIYDVFDHLCHALQHAADKNYSFHVKLAALFHDIGKPRTRRYDKNKDKYTFFGHEVVGARMTKDIMSRLKFPKRDIEMVSRLVRWHMFFSDTEIITLSPVRRMINNMAPTDAEKDVSREDHPIWELMRIRECDRVGMKKKEAPYRLRKYFAMIEEALRDPISVSQLKIDGNYMIKEMHMKPGPRMGWMLHALLEEIIEDPTKNTLEYLVSRVAELEKLSDGELKQLGDQGKEKKEIVDEEEKAQLHKKHGVKK
jgi:tRNA nucleotidyltransferase (CCA-adding enzyme)